MTTLAWSLISGCSAFIAGTCFGMWVIARKTETVDPNWDTDYASERTLCELNSRKLKNWSDSVSNEIPLVAGRGVFWMRPAFPRDSSPSPIATPPQRPEPPSPPPGG